MWLTTLDDISTALKSVVAEMEKQRDQTISAQNQTYLVATLHRVAQHCILVQSRHQDQMCLVWSEDKGSRALYSGDNLTAETLRHMADAVDMLERQGHHVEFSGSQYLSIKWADRILDEYIAADDDD